jgi:hypothetical protein
MTGITLPEITEPTEKGKDVDDSGFDFVLPECRVRFFAPAQEQ